MAQFYDPVTGGTYTTGAGGRTTSGQAASGGGINPATGKYEGGATQNNVPAPITPYSLMSLDQAKAEADKAFSGMVSPMTLEDIRKRETESKDLVAKTAENIYDPKVKASEALGRGQISTTKGAVGQGSGFNLSTAESTYLNNVQGEVQARTKELVDAKATYIANGNFDAAERADAQIQQLNEYNNQLTIAKANYALSIMSGNREAAQLALSANQAALQAKQLEQSMAMEKETLKLNAYKTALETPIGKTFTVDGVEYKGLADASGIDPKYIEIAYDDKGYASAINKITGETLWKSTKPTGKTKTAASSVTVNMPSYGSSVNKVTDSSGKVIGYIRFDSKSNQVIKQDINGNTIAEFPSDAKIGEPTATDDPFGVIQ